jgi:uncharacterized protein with HEPN domain
MKSNRDQKLLKQISEEITDIECFTKGITENKFMLNKEKQKAVCLSFQNIGEYVKNISKELKDLYADVEWIEIYGFRNIVAHEYTKIKMSRVWQMVQEDLPHLRAAIDEILRNL